LSIDLNGSEQSDFVVVTQRLDGDQGQRGKFTDLQHAAVLEPPVTGESRRKVWLPYTRGLPAQWASQLSPIPPFPDPLSVWSRNSVLCIVIITYAVFSLGAFTES